MRNIKVLLLEQGFNPASTGFNYLVDMLNMVFNEKPHKFTMQYLYKEVAKKYNMNKDAVERCVRYAIHHSGKFAECSSAEFIYKFSIEVLNNEQ